jgi:NCAIR mutase (PurE)-related protein
VLDETRAQRLGFGEAVFCAGKSPRQIASILDRAPGPLLLTRLDPDRFAALAADRRRDLDYDPVSRTAFFGTPSRSIGSMQVAVVTAGTSDVPWHARRFGRSRSRDATPS